MSEKSQSSSLINFIKIAFQLGVAIFTYFQVKDYIIEKIPITIEIANSIKLNNFYETEFVFNNGNSAIMNSDFIRPIEITLTNNIQKIIFNKNQKAIPTFKVKKNRVFFEFDLLNKEEKIFFKAVSSKELNIKSIDFRIKDIDVINFYQYIQKPKLLDRITNFWLVLFGLSVIFFGDALLLLLKDKKLGEMKSLLKTYPLNEKNKYDFLEKYRELYKNYKVRFKFPEWFFIDFKVKNLLDMYEKYTVEDVKFIKFMIDLNTEMSVLYRFRTIFVIASPFLILTSIIGVVINYFYYEFNFLQNYSLNDFNIILLRIALVVVIVMIIFPRSMMNYVFIKKGYNEDKNIVNF